jgi:hypothetical protein
LCIIFLVHEFFNWEFCWFDDLIGILSKASFIMDFLNWNNCSSNEVTFIFKHSFIKIPNIYNNWRSRFNSFVIDSKFFNLIVDWIICIFNNYCLDISFIRGPNLYIGIRVTFIVTGR